jgi:glycine amidinotransferase/scyllo-inosamine-4-phosphate amidinotransferase 1
MTISSFNEWDPLKKIVVGDATWANWPTNDPVFRTESERTLWRESPVPAGPVPDWIIEEANQDLENLCAVLREHGVEVLRPTPVNFQELDGFYNYCPRDRLLIHGSTVIDPAMMYPTRNMELQAYHAVVDAADQYLHMPRHEGMVLDAANVLRLNDSMLFLESASGNRAAYDWLCAQFPEVNIELCNFYAGTHIDSTITPLRDGVVVLNASRVTPENCPRVFDGWTKIWVDTVEPQGFFQYPYASAWIALNMLAIDPSTVIMDARQSVLRKQLESHGFTVIPLELRHSRTLGGGFHCVTLDLWRQHA